MEEYTEKITKYLSQQKIEKKKIQILSELLKKEYLDIQYCNPADKSKPRNRILFLETFKIDFKRPKLENIQLLGIDFTFKDQIYKKLTFKEPSYTKNKKMMKLIEDIGIDKSY